MTELIVPAGVSQILRCGLESRPDRRRVGDALLKEQGSDRGDVRRGLARTVDEEECEIVVAPFESRRAGAEALLEQSRLAGNAERYFPAVAMLIDAQ